MLSAVHSDKLRTGKKGECPVSAETEGEMLQHDHEFVIIYDHVERV